METGKRLEGKVEHAPISKQFFFFFGKCFIQRTRPKPFQINGYVFKANRFEFGDDCFANWFSGDFFNIFGADLYSGRIAVMADAKFDKSQLTQKWLITTRAYPR